MSKHDHPSAAPSDNPATRHDGWSLAKQAAFLRQLSATHSVTEAARSVGMSRQSAYRLRSRLKGQAFDLAWEVAFHHSYDVLAHAALERALNGVEVPVFFQGEQVGSYRKYDERLTVALLARFTMGGNPAFGRPGATTECHARDFEALLARLENGEAVATGALTPEDPGEFDGLRIGGMARANTAALPCPSGLSDAELIAHLQAFDAEHEK
ncbi:hypothetical protein [Erythrobacter sp. EC-HK427]|uniref:hypothetical protein n=1 Tax=Erythrobacter sp. EC-HK427 TaxID=2038396 RepID=UPI0012513C11|nr:hypothetical protein [Erythrobacter sp. EC-HK427]VVT09748.1 conserved hypothetical protein [Erythrobacter sp. EC-HK427]